MKNFINKFGPKLIGLEPSSKLVSKNRSKLTIELYILQTNHIVFKNRLLQIVNGVSMSHVLFMFVEKKIIK